MPQTHCFLPLHFKQHARANGHAFDIFFQVNTATVAQSLQHRALKDISAQAAQSFPHNTLADLEHTTMSLTRRLNQLVNCVILENTVKALEEYGRMGCVMRDFTVLVGLGQSVLVISVWPTMITQQALLIVVIDHLNAYALPGTRLQVQFVSFESVEKKKVFGDSVAEWLGHRI